MTFVYLFLHVKELLEKSQIENMCMKGKLSKEIVAVCGCKANKEREKYYQSNIAGVRRSQGRKREMHVHAKKQGEKISLSYFCVTKRKETLCVHASDLLLPHHAFHPCYFCGANKGNMCMHACIRERGLPHNTRK